MIGVLGGTFDPIHFGHLRPALDVLESLALEQVRLIPLNVPVHRGQPAASAVQRFTMVRVAVAGEPGLVADDRELAREGRSYSYDTLVSLREELGDSLPICLLTGSDAFHDFLSWRRPEGILALSHVVVMHRPGPDLELSPGLRDLVGTRLAVSAGDLAASPNGRILFHEVTQLDISATAIRTLVGRARSPRFLLPDPVIEFIEREGLYRASPRT